MDSVYVQAFASMVGGGLAGAAVNAFITLKRHKVDITLNVIKDFFAFYGEIGEVKGLFTAIDLNKILSDPTKVNLLRRVGDWHNYVASLAKSGAVDVPLLTAVGVIKEMKGFTEAVTSAKSRCPDHL